LTRFPGLPVAPHPGKNCDPLSVISAVHVCLSSMPARWLPIHANEALRSPPCQALSRNAPGLDAGDAAAERLPPLPGTRSSRQPQQTTTRASCHDTWSSRTGSAREEYGNAQPNRPR
jgi:hypothetical protein